MRKKDELPTLLRERTSAPVKVDVAAVLKGGAEVLRLLRQFNKVIIDPSCRGPLRHLIRQTYVIIYHILPLSHSLRRRGAVTCHDALRDDPPEGGQR